MRAVVLSSVLVCAAFGYAAFGCAAAPSGGRFTEGATNGTGAGSGNGGATGSTSSGLGAGFTTGTGASSGNGGGAPTCTTAAELVYVLSTDNNLWSFDPGAKQFTLIGQLGCNVPGGATPNSMAVDRNATAWVNYVASDNDPLSPTDTAGYVYQVSTKDASCAPAAAVTLQDPQWYRLGMGFFQRRGGQHRGDAVRDRQPAPCRARPTARGSAASTSTKGALNPIAQFSGDKRTSPARAPRA